MNTECEGETRKSKREISFNSNFTITSLMDKNNLHLCQQLPAALSSLILTHCFQMLIMKHNLKAQFPMSKYFIRTNSINPTHSAL